MKANAKILPEWECPFGFECKECPAADYCWGFSWEKDDAENRKPRRSEDSDRHRRVPRSVGRDNKAMARRKHSAKRSLFTDQ